MESKSVKQPGNTISIIIPAYNCKEYLPRCVDSLLRQTYGAIEIILVDDGSTDGTSEVCDRLASSDGRVRVIHKPNGGVSSARNAGIDAAEGGYITFADADDYVDPDHIACLYGTLQEQGCDVAVCGYESEREEKCSGRKTGSASPKEKSCASYDHDSAVCELLAGGAVGGYVWNKLYRRELLEGVRFRSDIKILEDLRFNFDVFQHVRSMAVSGRQSYHYIQRGQSAMHRRFGEEHRKMVETAREIRGELAGSTPELAQAGCGILCTTLIWVSDVMAEYGPYDKALFRAYLAEFKPLRRQYLKMCRVPFHYRASGLFFSMGFQVFRLSVKAVRIILG